MFSSGTVFSPLYCTKSIAMIPDKNQQRAPQTDQEANQQVSSDQQTSYRPDWIIPDNGISSRSSNRSDHQSDDSQDNSSIPMNNDETLGIP
jgi:hypothetical protein